MVNVRLQSIIDAQQRGDDMLSEILPRRAEYRLLRTATVGANQATSELDQACIVHVRNISEVLQRARLAQISGRSFILG